MKNNKTYLLAAAPPELRLLKGFALILLSLTLIIRFFVLTTSANTQGDYLQLLLHLLFVPFVFILFSQLFPSWRRYIPGWGQKFFSRRRVASTENDTENTLVTKR